MTAPHHSLVGQTVGGYEILELVGEGGMGAVYKARQLSLDRIVALKVLAPHLAGNEEFVARFKREARSIAKVNHSNILQVHDVADAEHLHFIAMEFIEGTNLSAKLKEKGFLDWRVCSEYVRQAALGLASAAKAGVIHRDIKPDNLMITKDDVVKVSDFGLAKEMSSGELTQTGDVMGTPAYMSPEQCDRSDLDTRTDIYSLGAAYYRAATGVLPFNAPTPVAMMYKHKHEALIPPKQYMPNLPDDVGHVIERMMEKRPEDRFPSMAAVAEAIDKVLQGEPLPALDSTLKISGQTPPAPSEAEGPPLPSFGAPAVGPSDHPEALSFEELVSSGDRLAQEGHILAACDAWRRALTVKPGDAAVKERLEKTKKESSVACLKIGEGLLEQGKLSAQRAELNRVLQVDPENVEAREKLAALEFMEQRRRQSLLQIRKMLSAGEQEKALEIWASLHPTLRDKALASTMDNLKNRVLPCQRLAAEAKALTEKGQFEEAFAKWDQAIELDPTNDRVKLGRQETRRYYDRMEKALRAGYEYNVKRQYQAAIDAFEQVLAISPDNSQAQRYILEAATELARSAEAHHDYETAVKQWQDVLERNPGDKTAMEQLEKNTRKRNALNSRLEDAKTALSKGRYGKSLRRFAQALELQPENKTALYGMEEARTRRLKRRVLPLIVLLVVGAIAVGAFLHMRFEQERDSGDRFFQDARAASPDQLEGYGQAIQHWEQARKVPLLGFLQSRELEQRIIRAEVYRKLDQEEIAYRKRELDILQKGRDDLLKLLDACRRALGEKAAAAAHFRVDWHIAHILAKRGEHKAAREIYQQAHKLQQTTPGIHFPVEQDGIRRALDNYLEARAILASETISLVEREKRTMRLLGLALQQWPEFEEAQTLLTQLREKQSKIADRIKLAEKFRDAAGVAVRAGEREVADERFEQALTAAASVLKLQPNHWDARKIAAEIEWRREAGEDMVFFIYPHSDDLQMARKFRAFALDRYEWPNRKGQDPWTGPFAKAVELAKAAGKMLPYRDEWKYAAQGGEEARVYPYGNEYDPAKSNAGKQRMRAWPCGSKASARTPEGLYDMAGNVAEWVRTRHGPAGERCYTAGGHYASAEEACRNDVFELRVAKLSSKQVGFRAARRWEIKRSQ